MTLALYHCSCLLTFPWLPVCAVTSHSPAPCSVDRAVSDRVTDACQSSHFCQIKQKTDEALGECTSPWPRQIITPKLPSVLINQGCSSLTLCIMNVGPWWWKVNPKLLDHYLHLDLDKLHLYQHLCAFTHLRTLRSPSKIKNWFLLPPQTPL